MLSYIQKRRLVDYHIESRRSRLTTPEGYDLAFMEKTDPLNAAFWRYDTRRKRHNLVFSEALDEAINRPPLIRKSHTPRFVKTFCERVFDHEAAHSLYTERDNDKLFKLNEGHKIPFHLWNMFEDARIESRWRGDFFRKFGWTKFMLLSDEEPVDPMAAAMGMPMNALRLFIDCKHMENSSRNIAKWMAKDKDPKVAWLGDKSRMVGRRQAVASFYRKAINMPSTEALIPLVQSWIKTFPETGAAMGEPGEGEGAGQYKGPGTGDMPDPKPGESGEMPSGVKDADGSDHKEIKETTEPGISGSGRGTADKKEAPKPSTKTEIYKGASKPGELPRSRFINPSARRVMNWARGDAMIRLFEKYLEGGEGTIHSRNPSGKIDMRKFLRGAEDFYLRKGEDPYGVKKISFIVDCSGSMSGAINEGVYLIYVLNELVRRRKIDCKQMILAGGENIAIPMPFDNRLIEHIQAPGSIEGFAHAMRQHEKDIVDSDLTVFFTDGNITDEHIDKAYWHQRGVYSVGLYTGDPSMSESLHRWFDSVLVRNSIEHIADSLVQLIKR